MTAEDVLETVVRDHDLLKNGLASAERVSEVQVTGNMGSSSRQLAGNGWVMVGDAAFFIDPCYSSGVHLAMLSGQQAADVFLQQPAGQPVPESAFANYSRQLRHHQHYVTRMVDAFYMASRNTSLQRLIVSLQGGFFSRRFVTFVGGSFTRNAHFIGRVFWYSKILSKLLPHSTRLPQNRPDYPATAARVPAPCEQQSEAA